ncbi:MAG: hypothetical protein V4726_11180 [Verrucomicrobiota bacterium]
MTTRAARLRPPTYAGSSRHWRDCERVRRQRRADLLRLAFLVAVVIAAALSLTGCPHG